MRSEVRDLEPGYYHEDLEPGGAERLVLRFPACDVVVTGTQAHTVHIELDLRGSAAALATWKPSVRRRESLLVIADELSGDVFLSEARIGVPAGFRDLELHGGSGNLDIRDCSLDILASTESGELRVEGGAAVEASSVSGSVMLSGMASAFVRTIAGSVRCSRIGGHLSVESQGGDVQADTIEGNIVALVSSGEISVQRPGGRLRLITVSGDVELEVTGPFAGGEISTGTGDVSLQLDGAHLELRGETLSGGIRAPGTVIAQGSGPRRCAMRLGSGGRRLHVKSVSGDIEIDS
ncbi:MAG: DUF4097 family beta strand repeat-containing protein [Rectinemataceae bacterium]